MRNTVATWEKRCVDLTHDKTRTALERYLAYRVQHQLGTALDSRAYRGLMPASRLMFTHKGTGYELSLKRRTNDAGQQADYWAADGLQSYVTKLYRDVGLRRGYSSHSGRRAFANRLLARGESLETVQALLGHSELDHVMPYIDPNPARARAALDGFAASFLPLACEG